MKIRLANKDDIEAISQFSIKTYLDAFSSVFDSLEIEHGLSTRSVSFYRNIFDKDTILLAENGNQIIGYAQFGDTTFTFEGILAGDQELQRIYVLSNYQGKGIGRLLIDAALAHPRLKNAKNIYLDVYEKNIRAQKLYKLFGFEEVGKIDNDIIMVKKTGVS